MSTRSQIIQENTDGTFTGAYIHCDGYPSVRGLECLAAKQEDVFPEFINYILERDDRDAYEYSSYQEILSHVTNSDLEWVYILHKDKTWTVLDVYINANIETMRFENKINEIHGDDEMLKDLIKKGNDTYTDTELEQKRAAVRRLHLKHIKDV